MIITIPLVQTIITGALAWGATLGNKAFTGIQQEKVQRVQMMEDFCYKPDGPRDCEPLKLYLEQGIKRVKE